MKRFASIYTKRAQTKIRDRFNSVVELSKITDSISDFHYSDLFLKEAIKLSNLIRIAVDEEEDPSLQKDVNIPNDKVQKVDPAPIEDVEEVSQEPIGDLEAEGYDTRPGFYQIKTPSQILAPTPAQDKVDLMNIINIFKSKLAEGGRDISKCLINLSNYVNSLDYVSQGWDKDQISSFIETAIISYFKIRSIEVSDSWIGQYGTVQHVYDIPKFILDNTVDEDVVNFLKHIIRQDTQIRKTLNSFETFLNDYYKNVNENERKLLVDFWKSLQNKYLSPNPNNIIKYFDTNLLLQCMGIQENEEFVLPLYTLTDKLTIEQIKNLSSNETFKSSLVKNYKDINYSIFTSPLSVHKLVNFTPEPFEGFNVQTPDILMDLCKFRPYIDGIRTTSVYGYKTYLSSFNKQILDYFLQHPDTFMSFDRRSDRNMDVSGNTLSNFIEIFGDRPEWLRNYIELYTKRENDGRFFTAYKGIIEKEIDQEKNPLIKQKLHQIHFHEDVSNGVPLVFRYLLNCNYDMASKFIDQVLHDELGRRVYLNDFSGMNELPMTQMDCNVLLKYMLTHYNFIVLSSTSQIYNRKVYVFNKYNFNFKLLYDLLGENIIKYNPKALEFISQNLDFSKLKYEQAPELSENVPLEKVIGLVEKNPTAFVEPEAHSFNYEGATHNILFNEFVRIFAKNPAFSHLSMSEIKDFAVRKLNQPENRIFGNYDGKTLATSLTMVPEGDKILTELLKTSQYSPSRDANFTNLDRLRQIGEEYLRNRTTFFGNYRNILKVKGAGAKISVDNQSIIPEKYKDLTESELSLLLETEYGTEFYGLIEEYQKDPENCELEKRYKRLLACKESIAKSKNYQNIEVGSLEYNKLLFAIYHNFSIRGRDAKLILSLLDILTVDETAPMSKFHTIELNDYANPNYAKKIWDVFSRKFNHKVYEDELNYIACYYLDLLWQALGSKMVDGLKYINEFSKDRNDDKIPEKIIDIIDTLTENKELWPLKVELWNLFEKYSHNVKRSNIENLTTSPFEYIDYGFRIVQIFGNSTKIILDKITREKYKNEPETYQTFDIIAGIKNKQKILHDLGVILPKNTEQNFKGLDQFIIRNYSPTKTSEIMKVGEIWNQDINIYNDNLEVIQVKKVKDIALEISLDELMKLITMASLVSLRRQLGEKVQDINFLMEFGKNYLTSDSDDDEDEDYEQLDNINQEKLFIGLQEIYQQGKNVPMPSFASYDKTINGVRMRFLPREDARGMFLGIYSSCCQHPKGWAGSCAIDGHLNPRAAFCVWEMKNEMIMQSYVWSDEDGNICFDSLETIGNQAFYKENVKNAISALLLDFTKNVGNVMVVAGNNIDNFFNKPSSGRLIRNPTKTYKYKEPEFPVNIDGLLIEFCDNGSGLYTSDSKDQVVLADNRPHDVRIRQQTIPPFYDEDDEDDEEEED